MSSLASLLADLTSGDDQRAELAVPQLPEYGTVAFDALHKLLSSEHPDTRWWAVRAFAEWEQSDRLVGELVAALQDESGQVRQCAAIALSRHPDPRAVSPLVRVLCASDAMTANLAANALVCIGPQAVPDLIEVLQGAVHTARIEAVRALAEINDPRAVPALMKVLGEDSSLLQYWAAHGLDKLGLGMVYLKP